MSGGRRFVMAAAARRNGGGTAKRQWRNCGGLTKGRLRGDSAMAGRWGLAHGHGEAGNRGRAAGARGLAKRRGWGGRDRTRLGG